MPTKAASIINVLPRLLLEDEVILLSVVTSDLVEVLRAVKIVLLIVVLLPTSEGYLELE